MYFLRENIGSITYSANSSEAYARLLSRLKELQLLVEKADASGGEIVICCLIRLVNAGIWRRWH
jgi:hypothetical protein